MSELVLTNCRLIDVETGSIQNAEIGVSDDRVARISGIDSARPDDAELVDLGGWYVMPGLISCHTHLTIIFPFADSDPNENPAITALRAYSRARAALRAGVTTLRTVGEIHRADLALRQSAAEKWVTVPRIFSAGRGLSVTGGHGHNFTDEADGADEFRKKSREEILAGADHLKIFLTGGIAHEAERFDESQMGDDEVAAVVGVARSKNTYVTAHVGAPGPIRQGLRLGVTCFEHVYDLDEETAALLAAQGAFVVPTLGVTRSPDWMRNHCFENWTIEKSLGAADRHLDAIKLAHEAGVTLVNGTDIPPGDLDDGVPVVIREIERLEPVGLTRLQCLQTATVNAGKLLRTEDLGVIREGAYADLVAMPENPLDDLRALRAIDWVMLAGDVVRQPER